ncbi:hypothetical protein U1Q18_012263 [Sarracenia purpurea var. burkii]
MVYKRPFHDEESHEVGCKHPRQHGYTALQSPVLGIACCEDDPLEPFSDEGENSARKSQDEGKVATETITEGANKELGISTSGNTSSYLWFNDNAIDEYAGSETAVHLSFFPHYFELDHHVSALVQPHDIYSILLDHAPIKLVSIGPDHQADLPEWDPKCFSISSGFLEGDDNRAELVGTCVLPMANMESSSYGCSLDGGKKNYCNCLDMGSIRCVKQHVMEAREELRENLGEKVFEDLGFCDMGEEVAKKWSEEEERTFHEVVLSNAASQGKNFWYNLSAVFPSRTKKDLVSYYFNVFMLRKRAEQNRLDPMNIDSDNDEWQVSDNGLIEEDDDDSIVESLDQDAPPAHNQENNEDELLEDTEEDDEGGIDDVLKSNIGNFMGDCLNPVFRLSGKISSEEDQDIQDDSCTSYEYPCDKVDSGGPVDLRTDARESR